MHAQVPSTHACANALNTRKASARSLLEMGRLPERAVAILAQGSRVMVAAGGGVAGGKRVREESNLSRGKRSREASSPYHGKLPSPFQVREQKDAS